MLVRLVQLVFAVYGEFTEATGTYGLKRSKFILKNIN